MSLPEKSSQAELLDFDDADDGYEDEDERPNWEPQSESEPDTGARVQCRTCGATVSRRYARVFGDNDNNVSMCPECSTFRETKTGAFSGDSA